MLNEDVEKHELHEESTVMAGKARPTGGKLKK